MYNSNYIFVMCLSSYLPRVLPIFEPARHPLELEGEFVFERQDESGGVSLPDFSDCSLHLDPTSPLIPTIWYDTHVETAREGARGIRRGGS